MHCSELNLNIFKDDFLNYIRFFFAPSDSRFTNIVSRAKYGPIITNHTSRKAIYTRFQMMYKSKFRKIYPFDWFVVQGHILYIQNMKIVGKINIFNNFKSNYSLLLKVSSTFNAPAMTL